MDIKKTFAVDRSLSEGGVWFGITDAGILYPSEEDENLETGFLIARTGNKKHEARLEEICKPKVKQMKRGAVPAEVVAQLARKALVGTVLLDWKGLTDGDKPLEFSEENALSLLRDLPELEEQILEAAADRSNFQREAVEAATENLSKSSTGKTSGGTDL